MHEEDVYKHWASPKINFLSLFHAMLTPIYSKHKIFVHVQSPISSVPQSHGMCDRDQLMVYLIISLITGNLEALQSTKICTECCRYAGADKSEVRQHWCHHPSPELTGQLPHGYKQKETFQSETDRPQLSKVSGS